MLPTTDYRGSILQSPPLALAITHEHAYIWDYTLPAPATHPRIFDVPDPVRESEETYAPPIAALVTNSHTKAVGLIIVSYNTGKVSYWENIDTAESLGLFQQRNTCIQGTIGPIFPGEYVKDLISADHAGFILSLSSGRIVHIDLQDSQGRPRVAAHFLRSSDAAVSRGFLGTIVSTFANNAWKSDVVAVHSRPLGPRREMQIIVATETAQIKVWTLGWTGQNDFKGSFDFMNMLKTAVQRQLGLSSLPGVSALKVLDMAINPAISTDLVSTKHDVHDTTLDVMFLLQWEDTTATGPGAASFMMANIVMFGSSARLERLISVRPETVVQGQTRLLLPKPGHTAYIVTGRQVTFVSLSTPAEDGPAAQLMSESHAESRLFQDALRLKHGGGLSIHDGCEEDIADSRGASACVVFVANYGLARITVNPAPTLRSKATAKSKIEQAIFYGTMSDNIFDFSRRLQKDGYDLEDIEEAAVDISREIVDSTSKYLPANTGTIDAHLTSRMRACRALIQYLANDHTSLSDKVRGQLLADAEKLAAAHAIWTSYDSKLSNPVDNIPKPMILPLVINYLYRNSGHRYDDPVRQWFINNVRDINKLRDGSFVAVSVVHEEHDMHRHDDLMRRISDADDIILSMYDATFAFRADNVEQYGLENYIAKEGIFEGPPSDISDPWTSDVSVFNPLNYFIDIARDFPMELFDEPKDVVRAALIEKVINENVRLINILCLVYRERLSYLLVQSDEDVSNGFAYKFVKAREHHLRSLEKIGQAGAGIVLAEGYHDLTTLVMLVVSETEYLKTCINDPDLQPHQAHLIQAQRDSLEATIQRYFNDFGIEWSTAYFNALLKDHKCYRLILESVKYPGPLSEYLRAEKSRGRLGWINNVLQEFRFEEACKVLTALAIEQESRVWNKKVELSLAKLVALAAQEAAGDAIPEIQEAVEQQTPHVALLDIQESIKASLQPVLFAAVDLEAEVQLVTDAYAMELVPLPALFKLIETAFEAMLKNIVLSPERLIDVLTLMNSQQLEQTSISGTEFYLALSVLQLAKPNLDSHQFDALHRLIWKRCWLSDSWVKINDTKRKSDKLVAAMLRETMVCKTAALVSRNRKHHLIPHPYRTALIHLTTAHLGLKSGIMPLGPTETLGAGCAREDLAHRFHVDDLIDPILRDNMMQDTVLRGLIEERRLEHWYTIIQDEARKMVEEEAEANVSHDMAAQKLSQLLNQKEREAGVSVGEANGHGLGRADSGEVIVIDDDSAEDAGGDGDVDMS